MKTMAGKAFFVVLLLIGSVAYSQTATVVTGANYAKIGAFVKALNKNLEVQDAMLDDQKDGYRHMQDRYVLGKKTQNVMAMYLKINFNKSEWVESMQYGATPTVLAAADLTFYNTELKKLKELFIAYGRFCNEIATHVGDQDFLTFTVEEGKKKMDEMLAGKEAYLQQKKVIEAKNEQMQEAVFKTVSATSPNKTYLLNMHADMLALKAIYKMAQTQKDIQANKADLTGKLTALETDAMTHSAKKPAGETGFPYDYSNFYSGLNTCIQKIKYLLNASGTESDLQYRLESWHEGYKSTLGNYNKANNQ